MKKFLALALILCLLLCCAGCGSKGGPLDQGEAQKIALKELGVSEKDASAIHVHVTTYEGNACFSFHVTVDGHTHEVIVDANTGDVLHVGESSH